MTNCKYGESGGGIYYGEGVDLNEPGSISVLGEGGGTDITGEGSKISIFQKGTAKKINEII